MTEPRRITRRDLHTTAHILGLIGNDIDNLWNHYAHMRAQILGYSAGTDEPRVQSSDISDPTARYAADLEHHRHNLEYIDASLRVIVTNANEIARAMQQAIGTRIAVPQCDGRGLQGFDTWGEACTDPATKAGLCAKHYMRAYRWRRDHGLGELRDTDAA